MGARVRWSFGSDCDGWRVFGLWWACEHHAAMGGKHSGVALIERDSIAGVSACGGFCIHSCTDGYTSPRFFDTGGSLKPEAPKFPTPTSHSLAYNDG